MATIGSYSTAFVRGLHRTTFLNQQDIRLSTSAFVCNPSRVLRASLSHVTYPLARTTPIAPSSWVSHSSVRLMAANTRNLDSFPEWIWTVDQDWWMVQYSPQLPTALLAAKMQRGIASVQSRLTELKDPSSQASERLFQQLGGRYDASNKDRSGPQDSAHTPRDVIQRIEWDYQWSPSDFQLVHVSPPDTPSHKQSSTTSKSVRYIPTVDAESSSYECCVVEETNLMESSQTDQRIAHESLPPEPCILQLLYQGRLVWDRHDGTMDRFLFGAQPGILRVMESYQSWKEDMDQNLERSRERQRLLAVKIKELLGDDDYKTLQQMTLALLEPEGDDDYDSDSESPLETFVQDAVALIRPKLTQIDMPTDSSWPRLQKGVKASEYWLLDLLSEWVATCPKPDVRETILLEIADRMENMHANRKMATKVNIQLLEDDLKETFVRGSGRGGQKINKTSNRVMLVHIPTNLRVECQDTRSLQQNRKIARKRLKEKVDALLNGKQSKSGMKQQKAAEKRQKTKNKNRARLRKKQGEKGDEYTVMS
eukprot:Nitzschia sp. Nitz4//scaffold232_size35869//31724//33337//NITZ4_007815-RA/size35869-processed-gene-0.22-mRNA-1//-1//CDS//3329543354//7450//frame0